MVNTSRIHIALLLTVLVLISLSSFTISNAGKYQSSKFTISIEFDNELTNYIVKHNLIGSISIFMQAPAVFQEYSYSLKDILSKNRVVLDFSRCIKAWRVFYKNNLDKLRDRSYRFAIPTVIVSLYLHDDRGNEYIAFHTYNIVNYLLDNEFEVSEYTLLNLLSTNNELTIEVKLSDLTILRYDFSKIIEKAYSKLKNFTIDNKGSCPAYFEDIWWLNLYRSRYTPPQKWLEKLANLSRIVKQSVWFDFAVKYSKTYYFRADLYSEAEAFYGLSSYIGIEGIRSLNEFLSRISTIYEYRWVLTWKNTIEPGTLFYIEENPNTFHNNTVISMLESSTMFKPRYQHSMLSTAKAQNKPRHSITTIYSYNKDGVLLLYDIENVVINGCRYWRITPIPIFVPLYVELFEIEKDEFNNLQEVLRISHYIRDRIDLIDILVTAMVNRFNIIHRELKLIATNFLYKS